MSSVKSGLPSSLSMTAITYDVLTMYNLVLIRAPVQGQKSLFDKQTLLSEQDHKINLPN